MQERLVGPRVGKWGQLQEWMEDRDDPKDDHRHTSHLFAVYPGRQISPAETPEFAKAAAVSLEARGETGDARSSWTWPWRCAIWARLGQGDKAAHMIDGLIQYNLLPNMIATHPPLQLDGSFGIVAGMCEMLVQSHAGQIQLLPALPAAWPNGSVTGLRARGGFEVGIEWKDGRLVAATVKSLTGNKCRVAYGKETRELEIAPGNTSVVRF
jgi:alpha-L-fucosidase 2